MCVFMYVCMYVCMYMQRPDRMCVFVVMYACMYVRVGASITHTATPGSSILSPHRNDLIKMYVHMSICSYVRA